MMIRRWTKRIAVTLVTLILLAGVGVFSLWWPWHREVAAIQMVQRRGGRIWTTTVGPKWLQDLLGQRWGFLLERAGYVSGYAFTDADISALASLQRLTWLNLYASRVTDAGLVHLKGIQLQSLDLWGTQVTDAGMEHLIGFKGLQDLGLCNTRVTDAGVAHLSDIKGMQSLNLNYTQVTDAGLLHLRELKQLRWLYLRKSQVTDAGMVYLKDLKGLQQLDVRDTQVTDEGIENLKTALPGCVIDH